MKAVDHPVGSDVQPGIRARRPAGRARHLLGLEDDDEAFRQHVEVVPLGGAGQVPGSSRPPRAGRKLGARSDRRGPLVPRAIVVPCAAHEVGRLPYGPQDPGVGAAATHVAGKGGADLAVIRLRMPREQGDRAHDHAGRAVAALERPGLEEGLLDGMQTTVARQALDGRDGVAGSVGDTRLAGSNRIAVEEHRARAALALAAAGLGASQTQLLAEREEQAPIRAGRERARHAVDDDLLGTCHARPLASPCPGSQHTPGAT